MQQHAASFIAHIETSTGSQLPQSSRTAEDLFAYIAAVAAHPGDVERFRSDLATPGLRIPLTADAATFADAVALGRRVVWLHTFGERVADAGAGREPGAPGCPSAAGHRCPRPARFRRTRPACPTRWPTTPPCSACRSAPATSPLIDDALLRTAGVYAATEAPKRKAAKAQAGPDLLTDVPSLGSYR